MTGLSWCVTPMKHGGLSIRLRSAAPMPLTPMGTRPIPARLLHQPPLALPPTIPAKRSQRRLVSRQGRRSLLSSRDTVTLSLPANATSTTLTFVIINRYLSNSTGTVTSVGVSAVTPSVLHGDGQSVLSRRYQCDHFACCPVWSKHCGRRQHTFYGNGSLTLVDQPDSCRRVTARTALGGTTVGQAIFTTLPTPVTAVVTCGVKSDDTVEPRGLRRKRWVIWERKFALTFSAPLARDPARLTTFQCRQRQGDRGFRIFNEDRFVTFAAQVPTSRKITTTAPLTIAGVSGTATDLSVDRVIAMPAAAGDSTGPPVVALKDGYLTGADHSLFVNKPPNSRTIAYNCAFNDGRR